MGFTFKGIHSSTFPSFYFKTTSLPLLPRKIVSTETVIGGNKKIRFDNGYEDRRITMSCVFVESNLQQRREDMKALVNWLTGEGQLTFDYEPNRTYTARIERDVNINMMGDADEFDIEFIADPYCMESGIAEWSYTDFADAEGSTTYPEYLYSINDYPDGTKLYPIITVTAKGTQTNQIVVVALKNENTRNIGAQKMAPGETVTIDGFNQTATFADGSDASERFYSQSGEWFEYVVGTDTDLEVYTSSGDIVDVELEWTRKFL